MWPPRWRRCAPSRRSATRMASRPLGGARRRLRAREVRSSGVGAWTSPLGSAIARPRDGPRSAPDRPRRRPPQRRRSGNRLAGCPRPSALAARRRAPLRPPPRLVPPRRLRCVPASAPDRPQIGAGAASFLRAREPPPAISLSELPRHGRPGRLQCCGARPVALCCRDPRRCARGCGGGRAPSPMGPPQLARTPAATPEIAPAATPTLTLEEALAGAAAPLGPQTGPT